MVKVLDLFAGAGGFSLGFAGEDGNNDVIAIEKDGDAVLTYYHNLNRVYRHVEVMETDIMEVDPSSIGKVDIIIGSPPCPDFSPANRFRTNDTCLLEKYFEFIHDLEPKWWIMEEVLPVANHVNQKSRHLSANEFGLPHRRKRLFLGNYPPVDRYPYRLGYEPRWNANWELSWVTCPRRDRVLINTPIASPRGWYHGAQQYMEKRKDVVTILKRYNRERPYDPVGYREGKNIKYWGKDISPGFWAWLMGFPENYEFFGNKKSVYRQIGNAVCPPVSRMIYNATKYHGMSLFDYYNDKVKDNGNRIEIKY